MSCLKYWCSRRGRGSSDLFPWIIKPKLSALAISDVFRNFRKKRTEKMERRDKFSVLIIFSVYHWLHKIVVCFPICRSSWIVNAVDFVIYKRVDSPDIFTHDIRHLNYYQSITELWFTTFRFTHLNKLPIIHFALPRSCFLQPWQDLNHFWSTVLSNLFYKLKAGCLNVSKKIKQLEVVYWVIFFLLTLFNLSLPSHATEKHTLFATNVNAPSARN